MQHGLLTRGDPVEGPMGDIPRVDDGLATTWLILPVVICLSQRLSHACRELDAQCVERPAPQATGGAAESKPRRKGRLSGPWGTSPAWTTD